MREGQYFVRAGVIVRVSRITRAMVVLDTPEGIKRVTKEKFLESSQPISRQQRRRALHNSQRTNAEERQKKHRFAHHQKVGR